jgi:hypothetical protein
MVTLSGATQFRCRLDGVLLGDGGGAPLVELC